jgi:uncharacterized protein (TIGR03437 family)
MIGICRRAKCLLPTTGLFLCLAASLVVFNLPNGFGARNRVVTTPDSANAETRQRIGANYGRLPLSFEANQGQAATPVKFLSRGSNHTLLLSGTEAALELRTRATEQSAAIKLKLVGANPQPQLAGLEPLPGKVNYLIGNDRRQWRTDVPTYAKVRYAQVYPGIDLIYYGNQEKLEYDFVIAPGSDPKFVRLRFEGVERLELDGNGDLLLQTANGEVRQQRPVVYQEIAGVRQSVVGRYVIEGEHEVGFAVGDYDASKSLVIDPVLIYAARGVGGEAITVDAQGNAYLAAGATITKLNPTGTSLIYSTNFGGSSLVLGNRIALDAQGNVYVAGATTSPDLPNAKNGFSSESSLLKSTNGGVSWNPSSNGLPFGMVKALAVNPKHPQTLYLLLQSQGTVFKSINGGESWQATNLKLPASYYETGLLAIDPVNPETVYAAFDGSTLRGIYKSPDGGNSWARLTGLRDDFYPTALVIDPVNPAILYTASRDNTLYKSTDSGNNWQTISTNINYINEVVIDPKNSSILYATGFDNVGVHKSVDGGLTWNAVSADLPNLALDAIEVDPLNPTTLYVAARRGIYKSVNSGVNWMLASSGFPDFEGPFKLRLAPADPATLYAWFSGRTDLPWYKSLDGSKHWNPLSSEAPGILLAIDPTNANVLYVGNNHPIKEDVFVAKFNPNGSDVIYSAYLGGAKQDVCNDLAVDAGGNIYLAGRTSSEDFPLTPNGFQTAGSGGAFVTKLDDKGDVVYSTLLSSSGINSARSLAIDLSGNVYLTGDSSSSAAYVAKLNPARAGAAGLVYFALLTGGGNATGFDLAVDANGQTYALGEVGSADFRRTPGAFQRDGGRYFLTKMNAAGTAPVYATLLGSVLPTYEEFVALGIDSAGNAYLTGHTNSLFFPGTPNAFQPNYSGGSACKLIGRPPTTYTCRDAFIMKLNAAGSALVYASYLGGRTDLEGGQGDDLARALAVDAVGNAYITGTPAEKFPVTSGALNDPNFYGFVARIGADDRSTTVSSVSAASFTPALAPEAIAAAFGVGLAAATESASGQLPEKLADVTLKVTDSAGTERPATLFFVSPRQINFQVPSGLTAGTAVMTVGYKGSTIATGTLPLAAVAPGLFSANADGQGVAAAVALRVRAPGAQIYEPIARYDTQQARFVSVPIELGAVDEQVFLILFGTGLRNRSALSNVTTKIGGVDAPVSFAGAQGQLVGLDQINVQLPRNLAGRGEVDVVVTVDGKAANTARVNIK